MCSSQGRRAGPQHSSTYLPLRAHPSPWGALLLYQGDPQAVRLLAAGRQCSLLPGAAAVTPSLMPSAGPALPIAGALMHSSLARRRKVFPST